MLFCCCDLLCCCCLVSLPFVFGVVLLLWFVFVRLLLYPFIVCLCVWCCFLFVISRVAVVYSVSCLVVWLVLLYVVICYCFFITLLFICVVGVALLFLLGLYAALCYFAVCSVLCSLCSGCTSGQWFCKLLLFNAQTTRTVRYTDNQLVSFKCPDNADSKIHRQSISFF